MVGGAMAGAGLFLGAFATRLEHLYLSLGGLTGTGGTGTDWEGLGGNWEGMGWTGRD